MPTYDFRCPAGHEFEHFFPKISESKSELPCPVCGQPAERRISGGAGLVFKGSGFYLTDYGKNAHRKGGGGGGDASKGESGAKGGEGSSGGEAKGGESKGGESKASDTKGGSAGGSSGGGSSSGSGGASGGAE